MNNLEWLNGKEYEPLSKENLDNLFIRLNNGEVNVKNEIAKHNMRLILYIINMKFYQYNDYEELFELGMIALVRAIDNFDINQNYSFTSYACTSIYNEILNFIELNKKKVNTISLNEPITNENDDDSLVLEQKLNSDIDLPNDYEDKELYSFIDEKMDILRDKEKEALKLRFGFDNRKEATFREIGIELKCSRAYAAVLVENGLKKIKKELIKQKYITEDEVLYKGYKKLY